MKLKQEIKPFIELIAALGLSFVLVLGLVHNLIKPFYDHRGRKVTERISLSIRWYFRVVEQIFRSIGYFCNKLGDFFYLLLTIRFWRAFKFIVHELARTIDLIGNVAAGEMIEDLITPIEKTYFGIGDITISAATGHIVYLYKVKKETTSLNKTGVWFDKVLNKAFNEKEHALWSFEREIKDHPIYGSKNFLEKRHKI